MWCYTYPENIVECACTYICCFFYISCYKPSFVAPVMIVYDGMSYPCSDDGCTSDADSEVGELQAMLGPNVPVYGSPRLGYTAHELISMLYEEDPKLKVCTQKPTGVQTFASLASRILQQMTMVCG